MKERWERAAAAAGLSEADAELAWNRIDDCYGEAHRSYHNLDHIAATLAVLDSLSERELGGAKERATLELALWFHDLIYDPRGGENEKRSAEEADCWLEKANWSLSRRKLVVDLILATQHAAVPASTLERCLVDIDLSILGSDRSKYSNYAGAIRREYAHVPEEIYRRERTRVLEGFLRRESLYSTAPLFARYEEKARENLSREIETLNS